MLRARNAVLCAASVLAFACGGEAVPPAPEGSFRIDTVQFATGGDAPMSVTRAHVTPAFFPATRTQPLLGRSFIAADHEAEAAVGVIGHDLWQSRFGARPNIIGEAVSVEGAPVTIVGILPQGFTQPAGAQLWMPAR
jgi:MacB-like periplasmic core domain